MRLAIVGAGAAGLAAALEAAGRADVTVVHASPGATALSTGALDLEPWEEVELQAAPPLQSRLLALVDALGGVAPAGRPALVATLGGRLRPARATDGGLLDLGTRSGVVFLPRVPRERWDADALAAALAEEAAAAGLALAFRAMDADLARLERELTSSDLDLAAAADEPARIGWLAERLGAALRRERTPAAAVLVGPWLGARAPRARALSLALGVPCGEALVGAGSPAGIRFEAARDALLERLDARVVRARVTSLREHDAGLTLALDDGRALDADAVVLALGGLLSGAFRFAPPETRAGADLPRAVSPSFESSMSGLPPPELSAGPSPTGVTSSLSGLALDGRTWPNARGAESLLETVGLRDGSLPVNVAAAGDCALGPARTFLGAAASGIAAVRSLLRRA